MNRWIPLLLLVLAGARAESAPAAPGDAERTAAFERLHADARITLLLDQAAADIKARRFEPALEKARAADALRPNDPVTLNTKGATLAELKRFDEAALVLAAAVAADPKAFAPQFNQAELLTLQKKYADAALQFALLQSRFGAIPILKYKIYLTRALAGQKQPAAEALRLLRYPEDGAAWYFAHAVDRLQGGDRREARRLMAAAKAIHGDDTSTYLDSLRESDLLE